MDLETMEAMVWLAVHWWSWLRRMWRCRSHVGLCHMRGWNPSPSLYLGYPRVGWLGEVVLGRQNHRNSREVWKFCILQGFAVVLGHPGDIFSRLKSPTIQHWPQNFLLPWVPQTWSSDPPNGHCTIPSTLLFSFFTQVANLSRHAHVRQLELNTAFWASRFGQWGHGLMAMAVKQLKVPFIPS